MIKLKHVMMMICSILILTVMGGCEGDKKVSKETTLASIPEKPREYENGMTENEKSKVLVEQSDLGENITLYDEEINVPYTFNLLKSSSYDASKEASFYMVLGSNYNDTQLIALRAYLDTNATQTLLAVLSYGDALDIDVVMKRDYVEGVQAFQTFLTDNVLGWLCENYKIDTTKVCLAGFETTGYFTSYILHSGNSVANYLIINPELHKRTEDLDIAMREETFFSEGNDTLSANVCLLRAEEDQFTMASTKTDLWIAALTEHTYKGLIINDERLVGVGHNTLECEALLRGMCYFDQKEYGENEEVCVAASKAMTELEKASIAVGALSSDHLLYEEVKVTDPACVDYIKEITIYDEEIADTFVIHISLPEGYDAAKKYPIVLMTDGVWRLSDHPELRPLMIAGEVEDLILVSVGYPNDYDYMKIRERDLLMQPDLYLQFLVENLMPYLCDNYSVDATRTTLTGHSYGGYWALYALYHSDTIGKETFANYYIGSPSLQAGTNKAFASNFEEWFYTRKQTLNCSVYMTLGSEETDMASMISSFVSKIEKHTYEGFEFEYEIIEGYDHNTVFKPSIKNTLTKYYGKGID